MLSLVHSCHEYYPHAEERRLFYVALTRARKHVYLVIDELGNVSQFIKEIQDNGYEVISNLPETNIILCPKCKTGRTIWRLKSIKQEDKISGWGECTNSKYCDYSPDTCPECGSGFLYKKGSIFKCSNNKCFFQAKPCPECDGYMKVKSNSSTKQLFLGCSNWKSTGCRHTEQLATNGM